MSSLTTENNCINIFRKRKKEKTLEVQEEFEKIKGDPALIKIFKTKYPNLQRRCQKSRNYINKKSKKLYFYPLIKEWFEILKDEFSEEDQKTIYKCVVEKIKGLYKHAQALKTACCNQRILSMMKSEEDTITICFTKNTLEANEQWFRRLLAEIKKRYPNKSLADLVMIVSSKKVNKDVTHCGNMNDAWSKLSVENEFKVVFCCSNVTRINDILDLTTKYNNLIHTLRKNIRIIHDEAHNHKEAIPPNRDVIENIILEENVLSYCPVTASAFVKEKGIADEDNPVWNLENLKSNGINYTEFDTIKSDSANYSSCGNARKFSCEELKEKSKWNPETITRVSTEVFIKVSTDIPNFSKYSVEKLEKEIKRYFDPKSYKRGNYEWIEDLHRWEDVHAKIKNGVSVQKDILAHALRNLYINRKRELEFHHLVNNSGKEKEAMENGINYLNMNNLTKTEFYKPKEFGLYILNTPNRKIITRHLAEEALKMSYTKTSLISQKKYVVNVSLNPIVLAVYGNEGHKYHLLYDGIEECVDNIMVEGEFNEKLSKLLKYLKKKIVNTDRPFIISGNYNPCGESISFAHTDYGPVRAVLACTSRDSAEDYQVGCRGNTVNNHFVKEHGPDWKFPEKFLVGPKKFLENIMEGERQNDGHVDDLIACQGDMSDKEIQINMAYKRNEEQLGTGTVATPIKIEIDPDSLRSSELEEIIRKNRRNEEDKINFMRILKAMVDDDDDDTEMNDKTGKFNWETYKLEEFRCYKNGRIAENYRFEMYQNNHKMDAPYINNTNKILREQCEILTCLNTYVLKDKTGKITYKNKKRTWYMGYKY